jgi:uncharacterized membrane protein required for colicin V production
MIAMTKVLNSLPINWFDVLLLVVLFVGIQRGRKRGMSEELLSVLQWLGVVLGAAVVYEPLGLWLVGVTSCSALFCYITAYVLTAAAIVGVFAFLKRTFSGKLVGSDTFGAGEYYLGMPAGMLRFACVLIALLSLLNARYYRSEEIKAMEKFQMDNYGSDFFPTLQSVQSSVFEKSLTGPPIKKYLSFLLIKPTPPETQEVKRKEFSLP